MAQRFVSAETIQQSLGITANQFRRWIRVTYGKSVDQWAAQFWAQGKAMVHQEQFEMALGTSKSRSSAQMLKWLGLQYLGQTHAVEVLHKPANEALRDETPSGYSMFTPSSKNPEVLPAIEQRPQEKDERPAVETLLIEEAQAADRPAGDPEEPEKKRPIKFISGHAEEL